MRASFIYTFVGLSILFFGNGLQAMDQKDNGQSTKVGVKAATPVQNPNSLPSTEGNKQSVWTMDNFTRMEVTMVAPRDPKRAPPSEVQKARLAKTRETLFTQTEWTEFFQANSGSQTKIETRLLDNDRLMHAVTSDAEPELLKLVLFEAASTVFDEEFLGNEAWNKFREAHKKPFQDRTCKAFLPLMTRFRTTHVKEIVALPKAANRYFFHQDIGTSALLGVELRQH